jgi:hypothetical protein
MVSGGLMSGTVSHNGKGYDIESSANVAAIASSVKVSMDDMICNERELLIFNNNRGKACHNLKNSELNEIVGDMKFTKGDVTGLPKKDICRLRIHYRLKGKLKRPGLDAT